MPPAYLAAVILVVLAGVTSAARKPVRPAPMIAVVFVIVLGIFSATMLLVALGVIVAGRLMTL